MLTEFYECVECANSKECSPHKHHFESCAERVMAAEESGERMGPKEDCVEECKNWNIFFRSIGITGNIMLTIALFSIVFHLAHCAGQCAAPKLWAQLK